MRARFSAWFGFDRMTRADWFELILVAAVCLLMLLAGGMAGADNHFAGGGKMVIPHEAQRYQRDLTRNARLVWGLDAPVATFAAQIHQESAWRAETVSPVGAQGMAQFMPATAKWISGAYPSLLGSQPNNPVWAMRALATYDKHLYDRLKVAGNECNRMWASLRSYNGGEGHWRKEAKLAADQSDRATVDAQCGKASRSIKHCPENLGYPRRIIQAIQPRYVKAGWGKGVCA